VVFFRYAYRSLLARSRATIITVLSVALFVAGGTLGLAYYLNLEKQLVTAPPENIIVVAKGAASETESQLPLENARKVAVLEGLASDAGQPVMARELVSRVYIETTDKSREEDPSTMRGIDERSFAVHHAKLVAGELPKAGTFEVLVGARLAQTRPYLKIGYELGLPGGKGRVTGVFSTSGSTFEDELWTPRAALEMHLSAKTSSSLTVVAKNAALVPQIVEKINASKDIDLYAASVASFRSELAGLGTIARAVLALLVMLTVVATFAIATTMSTSVLTRTPELAALAAIGIPKGRLARIVLVESALLAVFGALLGTGAGALIGTLIGRMPFGANPVSLGYSSTVLLAALVLALLVGVLGGVTASLQVRRIDVLSALR
jgi:putative ABC transport system permease protein